MENLNYSSNKNNSILIGCNDGIIINFDITNMAMIKEYCIGSQESRVLTIIKAADKIITGAFHGGNLLQIWINKDDQNLLFTKPLFQKQINLGVDICLIKNRPLIALAEQKS